MDDLIREEQIGNRIISVYPDYDAENPRKMFEPLGTLVEWHRTYDFGDQKAPRNLDSEWEVLEFFGVDDDDAFLPVYIYQHGNMTISTTPFNDRWDSGQVGWIFVKEDRYKKFGYSREDAEETLKEEIKELDTYVRGEYYYVRVTELSTCSCCGCTSEEFVDGYGGMTAEDVKAFIQEAKEIEEVEL